ncbi:MBL fold metallo-hydrolase [candidate division WOR-3 bacterium]|nr:MBL fold metallo-hydrolase [candidate division WOR-3 bacterium]
MQKIEIDDVTIERFMVGLLETNSYLLTSEDAAILIDPGFAEDELVDRVEAFKDLKTKTVLLTHGHFDHTGYCPRLQKAGWRVGIHTEDKFLLNRVPGDFDDLGYRDEPFEPYITLREGVCYNIGSLSLDVIHTPGHSPGSVCLLDLKKRIAFTGDTLFADSIGRSDLRGGDYDTLMESLKKLTSLLEPDTLILSGHGGRAQFKVVRRINRYL